MDEQIDNVFKKTIESYQKRRKEEKLKIEISKNFRESYQRMEIEYQKEKKLEKGSKNQTKIIED